MTIQNKPTVSCMQWSVVTLWLPDFREYIILDRDRSDIISRQKY